MKHAYSITCLFTVMVMTGCNNSDQPAAVKPQSMPVTKVDTPTQQPKPPIKKPEPPLLKPQHRIKTSHDEINSVFISEDGTRLAVGSDTFRKVPQIEIWDLSAEPKLLRKLPGELTGFSPDGKLLIRVHNHVTELMDVDSETSLRQLPFSFVSTRPRFVSANQLLTLNSQENVTKVALCEARTGKEEYAYEIPLVEGTYLLGPLKNNTQFLVGRPKTSEVEVWDLASGKMLRSFKIPHPHPNGGLSDLTANIEGTQISVKSWTNKPISVIDVSNVTEIGTAGYYTKSLFVPGRKWILGHTSWSGVEKGYTGWRVHDLQSNSVIADFTNCRLIHALTRDGKWFVSVDSYTKPGNVLVWDVDRIPKFESHVTP